METAFFWDCAVCMQVGRLTAHQTDSWPCLHKRCSSSPGLMCCVSVLIFYESYTCYKENWGPLREDRQMAIIPSVISMAGVAPYYNSDTLIKQEMCFSSQRKGAITSCCITWAFSGMLSWHTRQLFSDGFTALSGHLVDEVVLCAPCKLLK